MKQIGKKEKENGKGLEYYENTNKFYEEDLNENKPIVKGIESYKYENKNFNVIGNKVIQMLKE